MRRTIFFLMAMMGSVLGLQGSASADLFLQLSDNSGGNTGILTTTGALLTFSGTVGNFSVTLTAITSDNVSTGSSLNITNLSVSLKSGAGLVSGGDKLAIDAAGTNYSLPVGPTLTLASSGTATFTNSNSGDSLTYQSYLSTSNSSTAGAGTASGSSTLTSTGGVPPLSLSTPTNSATVTGRTGNYALSSITQIDIVSLAHPSLVDTTGSAIATAVPEPSTMAIAGLGALGMIGYGIRRRKGA